MRAGGWHTPRAGPRPKPACLPATLGSLPQVQPEADTSSTPALPAWPELLAPAAPGWRSSPVCVDMQMAMTLQEAGASGPGRVGVG